MMHYILKGYKMLGSWWQFLLASSTWLRLSKLTLISTCWICSEMILRWLDWKQITTSWFLTKWLATKWSVTHIESDNPYVSHELCLILCLGCLREVFELKGDTGDEDDDHTQKKKQGLFYSTSCWIVVSL